MYFIKRTNSKDTRNTMIFLQNWYQQGDQRPGICLTFRDKKAQKWWNWLKCRYSISHKKPKSWEAGLPGGLGPNESYIPSLRCHANKQNGQIKLFLANVRSAKGRFSDITALTYDYNIACLTETHLDDSVPDHCIIESLNKITFPNDHNIHEGGALIAIDRKLKPKKVDTNI